MSTVRSENLTARKSMSALQEDRCCDGWGIGVRFSFGAGSFLIAEAPSLAVGRALLTKHNVTACFFWINRSESTMKISLNLTSEFKKR